MRIDLQHLLVVVELTGARYAALGIPWCPPELRELRLLQAVGILQLCAHAGDRRPEVHAVDGQPGFLSFELLRPVKGENRYFVVTHWDTEESFQAWLQGPAMTAHSGERAKPVASGSSLLEFEVVQRSVAGS